VTGISRVAFVGYRGKETFSMEILGIGNALLDIYCFSDDETALSLGLHPNHSVHVAPERLDELLLAVPSPIPVAGGSAPNALKAAAMLGASCAFAGCTGMDGRDKDFWAQEFQEDLAAIGVKSLIENRNKPTGRCLVIHMPGGMKSIACAPSIAGDFSKDQLIEAFAVNPQAVFLDGQVLRNAENVATIAALCRQRDIPLALDVASAGIPRAFPGTILEILHGNKTILFMNSDESLALAAVLGKTVSGEEKGRLDEDFSGSVFSFHASRERPYPCIVEKRGRNGARAWAAGKCFEAKADPVDNPLDDTAAGDTFDGAFLVAYLSGMPVNDALALANDAAREALMVPGSRLDGDRFAPLKERIPHPRG
jgi:sugar/nucleoside kinase (ribokinase family)